MNANGANCLSGARHPIYGWAGSMSNKTPAAHEKGTYHMLKPIAGALLFAAFTALPVAAQENQVAATVDGEEITAADVAVAVSTLAPALEQVPAAQRPQVVQMRV